MKIAIHFLNTLKHGGGENVALNYAKISNELDIRSIFVGETVDENYSNLIRQVGEIKKRVTLSDIRKADYIFIHSNKNLFFLFFLYFIPIKLWKKRVFYIQHLMFAETKFKLLSFVINILCTDFIRISPITEQMVERYINIKAHFIVNFYISNYSSDQYALIKKEVYDELSIAGQLQVVAFSGVFKQGKNVGDFLELAKRYKDDPRFYFLVIGDGPEASLVDAYEYNNLKWLGFVNNVERYLIASDIYFFPSLFKQEMLPMALIEAINSGSKILAYSTEINNFLLSGKTNSSFADVCECLDKGHWPEGLRKYDKTYALSTLSQAFSLEKVQV